ncbi:DUF6090 family protein [Salegentibacter sp. F14]
MSGFFRIVKSINWKYSIGEVLLIVIGILIALALNNWKEHQDRKQEETEILKELVLSLENDLHDIEINIDIHSKSFNSTTLLLDHLKAGRAYHDSLAAHFGMALGSSFFLSDDVAYNLLGERGRELISDINIRSKLSTLYAHDYSFIKELEEVDRDYLLFNLQPYYAKNFKEFKLFQSATPRDYDDLRQDQFYIGSLEWLKGNRIHTVERYKQVKAKVKNLVVAMERVIQER